MAIAHSTAIRNSLADVVADACDVGSADLTGDLEILDDTLTLVEIDFEDPAWGDATGGVATLLGVPLADDADETGTADLFEIRSRDNTTIVSGTVTGLSGGGDIELDNTSIVATQSVSISALTYTAPV